MGFFSIFEYTKPTDMNKLLSLLLIIFTITGFSQATDVFLFDLTTNNGIIQLSNPINISNKPDYDNQPSFVDQNTIVYTSTNGEQTDIAEYKIDTGITRWVCNTPESEFSPTKIPGKNAVSAIRQGLDNTQKLYSYDIKNGKAKPLIEDLLIGYHVWADKQTIFTAILENNALSLSKTNLKNNEHNTIETNIGRSLHNIPNTNFISYISKSNDDWTINSFDPETNSSESIINTKKDAEDMCWTSNGLLLMGQGKMLYQFNPKTNSDWILAQSLSSFNIKNITRINVNNTMTKMVVVGEKLKPVAPKLENLSWISGTWKGEAFGGAIEEIWSEPMGDSMMASFKHVVDGKVTFYEIEIIRQLENSLVLQLKHFNNNLTGWETKDETVDFPLKEIYEDKVIFEGMVFEKISDTEMHIYVDIQQKEGKIETMKFEYFKE